MSDKMIKVWRFEDAPAEYQALSTNGGDEDWVVFVPDGFAEVHIPFLVEGGSGSIGCWCIEEHAVKGGKVCIGSHA